MFQQIPVGIWINSEMKKMPFLRHHSCMLMPGEVSSDDNMVIIAFIPVYGQAATQAYVGGLQKAI
jgi:hypothetical protein